MILLVVLPSLVYMSPQTRTSTVRCPACRHERPFAVRKFVPRDILHTSGSYRINTYALECPKDGLFSLPVLGLVDQTISASKQRLSAALHLEVVADYAGGMSYAGIVDDLDGREIGLSRSTIWRQLRKAPQRELRRIHLLNRSHRVRHLSVSWQVDQSELDRQLFTERSTAERDTVVFGGIVGMVFDDAGAANETKRFLDEYIDSSTYRWTWCKVAAVERLPDNIEMPDDFPCQRSLGVCLQLMQAAYELVTGEAKHVEPNSASAKPSETFP